MQSGLVPPGSAATSTRSKSIPKSTTAEGICHSCLFEPPPHQLTRFPKRPLTKVYHHGGESDNICFQTDYTDPHYVSIGYVPGFCPFQLLLSKQVETVCNGHSDENLKYCPDSKINITIYKFGKSDAI